MSDAVASSVVGEIGTIVVPIAIAWIGYMQFRAKLKQDKMEKQQDKIVDKQHEMQGEQQATAKVAVETRDWVNGLKADQLRLNAIIARRLAVLSKDPDDEFAAELAEKMVREHSRQQDKNDVKDVKIAKVEEQVRVDDATAKEEMKEEKKE